MPICAARCRIGADTAPGEPVPPAALPLQLVIWPMVNLAALVHRQAVVPARVGTQQAFLLRTSLTYLP